MGLSEHFWIWRNYIKPFHVGCVFVAKFPGAMRRHWTHQKKGNGIQTMRAVFKTPVGLTILYGVILSNILSHSINWEIRPLDQPAIRDSILGFEALQLVDGDGFSFGKESRAPNKTCSMAGLESHGRLWVKIQTQNSGEIDVYPPPWFLISPSYPQVVDSTLYTTNS